MDPLQLIGPPFASRPQPASASAATVAPWPLHIGCSAVSSSPDSDAEIDALIEQIYGPSASADLHLDNQALEEGAAAASPALTAPDAPDEADCPVEAQASEAEEGGCLGTAVPKVRTDSPTRPPRERSRSPAMPRGKEDSRRAA